MREKKYLRDSLYLGQVYPNSNLVRNSQGLLASSLCKEMRNILFQPSRNLFSIDLLNPHITLYPVLNFSSDEACFKSSFIVSKACSIDDFLASCGFSQNLTKKDIQMIKKYFLLVQKICLYRQKVTVFDLKKFHKKSSYEIYENISSMPLQVRRILQTPCSFQPLKDEKTILR